MSNHGLPPADLALRVSSSSLMVVQGSWKQHKVTPHTQLTELAVIYDRRPGIHPHKALSRRHFKYF